MHVELEHVKQLMVDNGFKYAMVQECIRKTLESWYTKQTNADQQNAIKLYYKAQMSTAYKVEEKVIKRIINNNVKPRDPEKKIQLNVYYKSKRTSNLLIKNNTASSLSMLQRSNVVYKIECKHRDGTPCSSYIGRTQTKLSRRLTCHLSNGAPKEHYFKQHKKTISRNDLVKGASILAHETDIRKLCILEALFILKERPSMNQQTDMFQLPSNRILIRSST